MDRPQNPNSDRNLLFGMLALQMDFISRDALIAAMHAWVLDKGKSLGRILLEQQHLAPDVLALLDALVEKHLAQHGNDAQQSLAALAQSPLSPLGQGAGAEKQFLDDALAQIGDKDLQASLAAVAAVRGEGEEPATRSFNVGTPTSSGLRFQILRPWAEGGLGKVSVAHDGELRREVALKEIKEKHADDPASRGRFLQEAEITGGLEHPGIVPVYGLGAYDDGRPFYAMRFIRGDSLKTAIDRFHKKGTTDATEGTDKRKARDSQSVLSQISVVDFSGLEFRKLLGRFVDVCNAIAYAHSRGVLHRDLKPGNIMLGKYGETLVVDWGLAKTGVMGQGSGVRSQESGVSSQESTKAQGESSSDSGAAAAKTDPLDQEPPLTPSGSIDLETIAGTAVGTPAYMSPEQAAGRLDLLSPASDVYSLGATLFAILTGQPPLRDLATPEILQRVQHGDVPGPRALQPHVPAPLDAVCRKAMALRPVDRYASPRAMADDIEHWLADEPVSAWPEPWTVKSRRWIGRHRVIAASVAATIVVSAGLLLAGNVLLRKANTDLANANASANLANEKLTKAVGELEISEKAAQQAAAGEKAAHETTAQALAMSYMMLARNRFEENDAGLAAKWLGKVPLRLRGSSWGLLKHYIAGSLFTLAEHTAQVADVAVSPDGRWLASASWDKTIILWDARTGQIWRTLRGHTGLVTGVAFSPDSQWLASASADTMVKLWELFSEREPRTFKGHTLQVEGVAFSPDGTQLASASADRTAVLWDVRSGQRLQTLARHSKTVYHVTFSSDGRLLATASADKTAIVWDLQTGAIQKTFAGHILGLKCVAFSPDQQRVATASQDQTVKVWDVSSAEARFTLTGLGGAVNSVAFSPDGQRLAAASADRTVRIFNATTGQGLGTLKGHADAVAGVAFSRDGRRLYSAGHDGTVKIWQTHAGDELRTLITPPQLLAAVVISADGHWLASASFDRTVTLWDAWTGRETRVLHGHADVVNAVAISADGQMIASASSDGSVKVWDARAGVARHTLAHDVSVNGVAISPDGAWLASASADGTVKTWDARTGKLIGRLRGHESIVRGVAISPDGEWLASASFDKTVKLWRKDADKPSQTFQEHDKPVSTVAFSRDGRWLASGGDDKAIILWDLTNGEPKKVLRGHAGAVTSLAFGPDSQWLVSASGDMTLRFWDVQNEQELRTLRGHTAAVTGVAVSPDGQWLISSSHDRTLKVWDARSSADAESERRFRHWLAVPDLQRHREQADAAKKTGNLSAIGFHLAWYLAGQAELADGPRRQAAHAGWFGVVQQPLAGVGSLPSLTAPTHDRGSVLVAILTKAPEPILQRARTEAALGVSLQPADWFERALHGAVLCRSGDIARALDELNQAWKQREESAPKVLLASFLAIVNAKLGRHEEARRWQSQSAPAADAAWEERTLHDLLRPEVEAAFLTKPSSAPQ